MEISWCSSSSKFPATWARLLLHAFGPRSSSLCSSATESSSLPPITSSSLGSHTRTKRPERQSTPTAQKRQTPTGGGRLQNGILDHVVMICFHVHNYHKNQESVHFKKNVTSVPFRDLVDTTMLLTNNLFTATVCLSPPTRDCPWSKPSTNVLLHVIACVIYISSHPGWLEHGFHLLHIVDEANHLPNQKCKADEIICLWLSCRTVLRQSLDETNEWPNNMQMSGDARSIRLCTWNIRIGWHRDSFLSYWCSKFPTSNSTVLWVLSFLVIDISLCRGYIRHSNDKTVPGKNTQRRKLGPVPQTAA